MTNNHQFWAPCESGGGDRPTNVQLWAIVGSSMLRDLDLGCGQGHINIHSTCRTSSLPNHVTVASHTTKIWPFEFREISTLDDVWTLVIAFLEGNSKIGLRQCSPGRILSPPTISFEVHVKTMEETDVEKCNFCNVGRSVTLTLTLDRVVVTLVCICGRGLPTHQIRWKSEKLCGRTYGRTSVPIY